MGANVPERPGRVPLRRWRQVIGWDALNRDQRHVPLRPIGLAPNSTTLTPEFPEFGCPLPPLRAAGKAGMVTGPEPDGPYGPTGTGDSHRRWM
jgi:hypothetical protein